MGAEEDVQLTEEQEAELEAQSRAFQALSINSTPVNDILQNGSLEQSKWLLRLPQ